MSAQTEIFFWAGVVIAAVFAVLYLFQVWNKAVEKNEGVESFLLPVGLTVVAIAAFVCIWVGNGPVSTGEKVQLNANSEARQDFVQSYEQEEVNVKPTSRQELQDNRELQDKQKKENTRREVQETDEQIGDSIQDFRQEIMNRQ